MKKIIYLLIMSAFVSSSVYADFTGPSVYQTNSGFQNAGTTYSVSQVKDVLNMYDDQIAVVQGNITKRLSDDKYLFKDKSGEMVVEIDYKYWANIQVDENNILELTGKVDRDYNTVSLDVFIVKKVK